MSNGTLPQRWSKYILIAKILRYIFGLALVLFIFVGVPIISHQSPVLIFMFTINLPGALVIDPVIAAGLYFMFTGKFRPRVDITILILAAAALAGLIMLMQTPQNQLVACTQDYNPVCGTDGKTYSNVCVAEQQNNVKMAHAGECKK